MKLLEIFRFELAYRLRRPSTWIYGGLLFGLPFLMMHAIDGSDSRLNTPALVAQISTALGMLGMLVTAALFGDAATRDIQTGLYPLIYTAPLRKAEYLGGRFLGALFLNAILLLGVPLGLALGAQMPYLDPQMFGPFQAGAYAQPYLLFLLPNLVLSGAILFAVAALTRQTLPAYLTGVVLVMLAMFGPDSVSTTGSAAAAVGDPFGTNTLEKLTQYWTPAELDARLIGFPKVLLWNRLFWITAGVAVLIVLYTRFRFRHPGGASRWRKIRREVVDPGPGSAVPVVVPLVERAFGVRTRAWQTLAVATRSFEEIARSRVFLLIFCGALFFVFAFGWNVGEEVFGTSTWPVTHLIAGTVLSGPVSVVVAVLIALFAGELVWRERDAGVSEIVGAAPVPNWVLLLGKFLALAGMLVALQVLLMAAGVTLQALQGYFRFELALYLKILFGLKLADYVLLAALAMAVHVVVNQKYVGHLVLVLYFVFAAGHAPLFGVRHNLLVYGSDPGWVYSDMNGFGPFVAPLVWFKLYWAAWALLFAVAANLLWVRERESGARRRISQARSRFTGPAVRAAGVAAVLILALGGFIFYNTNILNDYRTPLESGAPRAEYERRYKQFEDVPQPRIAGAELRVEIYPEERSAELSGTFRLVNRTAEPIDSIHVIVHPDIWVRSLSFDRPAAPARLDPEIQYHIYALERALAPGDSLRLMFGLGFRPRGFPNSGIPTAVVRNGAYFDRRWLPIIGYQPGLELTDAEARREHDLPLRAAQSPDDPNGLQHRFNLRDADLVGIEAVIGTDDDQIAVTPGALLRTWRENGRRYFHYRSESPLPFGIPFLSAEYQVLQDRWNDVALQIFHHPTHAFNLDRMVRSMKASLDYNTRHFGPYPYRVLRIVEFPRYASFARAHPHTIAYSEGSSFLTRVEDGDVDRPFFVTAHETAHQWWGNQIRGAEVPGAALLTETLAQYSAMMVMEQALGRDQVRRFYDYEMDHYLRGRRVFANREVPLLEVEDQAYLFYHKGAVAMYTLREHIGEERVNTALRRFLEQHRAGVPPYPTSRDLYAELRAVTPDSLHILLRDLFEEITLWNIRTETARVEPAGTGEYRVTLDVRASKVRADSIGNEREVPMSDLVEIGVFAGAASGDGLGEPLYLRRHRIRSGQQTITVVVPREPARAGIDPYRKLIDRKSDDNLVEVAASASADRIRDGR